MLPVRLGHEYTTGYLENQLVIAASRTVTGRIMKLQLSCQDPLHMAVGGPLAGCVQRASAIILGFGSICGEVANRGWRRRAV
jgi:hypothetical protein